MRFYTHELPDGKTLDLLAFPEDEENTMGVVLHLDKENATQLKNLLDEWLKKQKA